MRPSENDWIYWQYHNRGRVDGIKGDVDLNVLKGGHEKLAELFAAPESASAQTPPSP
jgi:lysozyme